jgi:hypothetical protein
MGTIADHKAVDETPSATPCEMVAMQELHANAWSQKGPIRTCALKRTNKRGTPPAMPI